MRGTLDFAPSRLGTRCPWSRPTVSSVACWTPGFARSCEHHDSRKRFVPDSSHREPRALVTQRRYNGYVQGVHVAPGVKFRLTLDASYPADVGRAIHRL